MASKSWEEDAAWGLRTLHLFFLLLLFLSFFFSYCLSTFKA
jgi:hypothetical protein